MTPEERDESLVNARLACLALTPYVIDDALTIILGDPHREQIACLLEEFSRLDAKEQRQREAGAKGAKHGKKGGRPVKKKKRKKIS